MSGTVTGNVELLTSPNVRLETTADTLDFIARQIYAVETVSSNDRLMKASDGVIFKGGIDDQPWGRFASFTDPDGNGLILREGLRGTD